MQKETIGIIGNGYVGKAIGDYFGNKFNIALYDPAQGHTDKAVINGADLVAVCVPTNMNMDGTADLSAVTETFSWLTAPRIVLKSTVPPGTTAGLIKKYRLEDKLVFSPEFVGEGGYPVPHWEGVPHATDMKLHSFFIFGGSDRARAAVIPYFERISGPYAHYAQTDSTTAELMKYMMNSWIAAKVTFCNEFFNVAKAHGVDYRELRELWLLDKRVTPSHTIVYENKRGFDGKCIPKDLRSIIENTKSHGYIPTFLEDIAAANERMKKVAPLPVVKSEHGKNSRRNSPRRTK